MGCGYLVQAEAVASVAESMLPESDQFVFVLYNQDIDRALLKNVIDADRLRGSPREVSIESNTLIVRYL